MYGFGDAERVARGEHYTIWRAPSVLFIHVSGEIDDARSAGWQRALQAEYDRGGYPRFAAMDATGVDPSNSMQSRFRTAQWVRTSFANIEQGAVLVGVRPGPLVVVRAVLRIVGLEKIALFTDRAELQRAIDDFRAGRPLARSQTA